MITSSLISFPLLLLMGVAAAGAVAAVVGAAGAGVAAAVDAAGAAAYSITVFV